MSINDSILNLLNIEDPNIFITDPEDFISTEKIHGIDTRIIKATLSYPVDHCPHCLAANENNSIIKYGTKSSDIVIPQICKFNARLRLNKQRYLCRNCDRTFCATTDLVEENCFISNDTKLSIIMDAKHKTSEKDIARLNSVSHMTVNRTLGSTYGDFTINKNYLPPNIGFDEFRSVKDNKNNMAFICVNNDTGELIDTFQGIRQDKVIKYFNSYSRKARMNVKTVCMDMHFPYYKVVRTCFPNAKIITDRFHIVQLISRALNQTRIDYMKQDDENYRKLKRYWRLILKHEEELNMKDYRNYLCFTHMMTEYDVVQYLISLDQTLHDTYDLYQSLLKAMDNRNTDSFYKHIESAPDTISSHMKKSCRTMKKNKEGIANSMKYTYSNGVVEGTNNLIKVIKRIAFGYKSFVHFKIRILLISNTMVKLGNFKT